MDMNNIKMLFLNLILDKVEVNGSMFHAAVEHGVVIEIGSANIITINHRGSNERIMELTEKVSYPI